LKSTYLNVKEDKRQRNMDERKERQNPKAKKKERRT